ncbi:alpha/beta hydrolase [Streptomyces chrestomyceticus]|uniref:alpha/beta hydrolase n=1 Tax=Streptomyces chrestomyceticus TaxID=68185 RepID=UPI00378C70F8
MTAVFGSVLLVSALLPTVVLSGPPAHAHPRSAGTTAGCGPVTVRVTVEGETGAISGRLCRPARPVSRVQLLVPGFTFGKEYWDFPEHPGRYSYTRAANAAGWATLAIDRLGSGTSWHPKGSRVTFQNSADAVHQVVQALRKGLEGTAYDRVALVGHSVGAHESAYEAGTYNDVDALIATGWTSVWNAGNVQRLVGDNLVTATSDPKFEDSGYDPDYVTSKAGTRDVYFATANADPAVLAADEKLKQTSSQVELSSGLTADVNAATRKFDKPVLLVAGDRDPFFCGAGASDCSSDAALAAFEKPYFGPRATVRAAVEKGSGHALQLQHGAPRTARDMLAFLAGPEGAR